MKSLVIVVPKMKIHPRSILLIIVLMTILAVIETVKIKTLKDRIHTIETEIAQLESPKINVYIETTQDMKNHKPDVPIHLQHLFNEFGGKYGVEPTLLAEVARKESNFNYKAKSIKGAMGLMQLMPITIKHLKIEHGLDVDPWDDRSAVEGAACYLSELQSQFTGLSALAAYNLGPTRLRALGGDWSDVQETTSYVQSISSSLGGAMSGR